MALTIPYVFTAGTPAKAAEVNSNFTAISNWANSNSFDTESFGILYPRVSPLPSTPYYPILRLEQSSGNQALYIRNSGTGESIEIVQNAALGAGKSAILLTDSQTQTGIGCAELKMVLGANVDIPAIHITHNSVDIFKVNQNGVKPPVKTTVQRNAIVSPETGSIIYNSSTQQLNEKRGNTWAPVGSPVGTVVMYAGASAPEGWLLCNGDTVPSGSGTVQTITADFSTLYTVLGSTYGGAGKLPDLRGMFVRGAGTHGSAIGGFTPAGVLGTEQADATAVNGLSNSNDSHAHKIKLNSNLNGYAQGADGIYGTATGGFGVILTTLQLTDSYSHTHALSGDTETRPVNVALTYIIKY